MVRKLTGFLLLAVIAAVLLPLAVSAAVPRFVSIQTSEIYIEAGESVTFTISTTDVATHVFAPIDGTRVQATRVNNPAPPAGTRNWVLTFTPATSQTVTVHANTRNAVADAAVMTIPVTVIGDAEPVAINRLTRNIQNPVAGETVRFTVRFTVRTPASVTHVFTDVGGTRVQANRHQVDAATGEIVWRLYFTPQETQRLTIHANNSNSTTGSARRIVEVVVTQPVPLQLAAPFFDSGLTGGWTHIDIGPSLQALATVRMSGVSYDEVVIFRSGTANRNFWPAQERGGFTLHNLGGQYSLLTGHVGRVDGSSMFNATLNVIGDGRLLQSFRLSATDMPTFISVPVVGVRQLRIEIAFRDIQELGSTQAEYAFSGYLR